MTLSHPNQNAATPGRHLPTEQILDYYLGSTNYSYSSDGSYYVAGNLNLSKHSLTVLPDLSRVHVHGYFDCSHNQLTSLTGAPLSVGGSLNCGNNKLTSLTGAPQTVRGHFSCDRNQLTSLIGGPQSIDGDLFCEKNLLTSLTGGPQTLKGWLLCKDNPLVTLFGIADCVSVDSDLGQFERLSVIPAALLRDIEGEARAIAGCATIQNDMSIEPGGVIIRNNRQRLRL
jgi:hypothetical protein